MLDLFGVLNVLKCISDGSKQRLRRNFADDVVDRTDAARAAPIILTVAATLPDAYKQVLQSRCRGLSYQEIAQELGLPLNTVRSRLSRARILLRELMDIGCDGVVATALGPVDAGSRRWKEVGRCGA